MPAANERPGSHFLRNVALGIFFGIIFYLLAKSEFFGSAAAKVITALAPNLVLIGLVLVTAAVIVFMVKRSQEQRASMADGAGIHVEINVAPSPNSRPSTDPEPAPTPLDSYGYNSFLPLYRGYPDELRRAGSQAAFPASALGTDPVNLKANKYH
jgi:hypothetical protein